MNDLQLFRDEAAAVFKMAGCYWLARDQAEIAEVQDGKHFWADPQEIDSDQALVLLDGREPPLIASYEWISVDEDAELDELECDLAELHEQLLCAELDGDSDLVTALRQQCEATADRFRTLFNELAMANPFVRRLQELALGKAARY